MQDAKMRDVTHFTRESEPVSAPTGNGLSLRDLWRLFAKHRKVVLGSVFGAGLIAGIISIFIPNEYTAVVSILPPQQSSSLSSILTAQIGSISSLGSLAGKEFGLKDPNDFYIGMLQSRVVEDALVRQFGLSALYKERKLSRARKALERHSTILSTKTGFITVSVEDRDPNRAAAMANAYVQQLQTLTSTIAVTEAGQRRKFFDQQLQDAQTKLVTAQQKLKDTQQQTGVLQLDAQMRATIEYEAQLRAQIAAQEVELQTLSSYATDQNAERVRAEQQLAGLRKQLDLLQNRPAKGKGDIQVSTSQLPAAGTEYLNQVRDVRYNEMILELLAKQFEAAKLDEARQGAVIQVLDPAVPPDTKSSPRRSIIILLAAFLGFFGSLAYIVARELVESWQGLPRVQQYDQRVV
jgi:uncharacterized protein involved in exopolysaccharide biosynthesis